MVPEAQPSPSPSPSPPHAADGGHADPAVAPMQQRAGDGWSEEVTPPVPPHSTAIVVSNAAKYVPPRAADRTADPRGDGRSWYSWNGGRTKAPRPQPQPRQQPQPRVSLPEPKPRSQLQPKPVPVPVPAPAPALIPTRSFERDRRVMPDTMSRKRRTAALQRTALVARAAAAGLCLAALAVLAADSRKGWSLDSFSNYTQLRYLEAVNVIGFLYSVFQFFALAALLRRNRHLIPRHKGDYFDFTMDQVLAYLLISSSSSATARVGDWIDNWGSTARVFDWIDNWGSDPFPNMANSSIAISFLAFLVFAINSLISAYNLFRGDL